jgi:hypothetical protein
MGTYMYLVFAISVSYAVIGNATVLWILIRRGVEVRFLWSGTPGYLYRICAQNASAAGKGLRRFALSTNIAFIVAILAAFYLAGLH